MEHEVGVYGRRSIRLRGYDYTQVGAYFVTIAVRGRLALFGEVVDGEVRLNGAGEMVCKVWQAMPQRFPFVAMDAFVAMPDHVHGIVVIRGGGARAPIKDAPTPDSTTQGTHEGCPYTGQRADGVPAPRCPPSGGGGIRGWRRPTSSSAPRLRRFRRGSGGRARAPARATASPRACR